MPPGTTSSAGSTVLEHSAFFTGAVPADTVEDVFRTLAGAVGPRALAYPDGEINDRRYWIGALKNTVWSRCDGTQMIPSEMPGEAEQDMFPAFRLRDGVTEVHLEGLLRNDGLEAMERRIVHARNFLDRFGVSHYCGYAFNTEILPQLLTDLRDGADRQATAMGAR